MSEVVSELLSVKSAISQIDDLQTAIASTHSLHAVLAHRDFQYSLNMRYDFLVEFLSRPDVLMEAARIFQNSEPIESSDFDLSCKIAYFAHLVFASNIPQIVRAVLDQHEILNWVFRIATKDPALNLTAQGYLFEIFKALINDANCFKFEVFAALAQDNLRIIIPMIHCLSAANASCIKELLTVRCEEAGELQSKVFNYLIDYFLQEKQDAYLDFAIDEFTFENLRMIFQGLTSEYKHIKTTCCNSHTLVSIFRSEYAYTTEYSFHFRILLAKYWVSVGQVTDYSNVGEIYSTCAEILNAQGSFLLKKDILELFKTVTKAQSFVSTVDESFLELIYRCIGSSPFIDVIQNHCFQIIGQVLDGLTRNANVHLHVARFITAAYRQSKVPNVSSKFPNKVSLHFIAQTINKINSSLFGTTDIAFELETARGSIKSLFAPFDTEDSTGELSDFSSIVKIIKQDNLASLGQSFKPNLNLANNIWNDWSQEIIIASPNDSEGLDESGSPKPNRMPQDHFGIRMIKTHSMNLSKADCNLIGEDGESEHNFNSQRFNVGSIERFDDLSPRKGLDDQLFSPQNSGLFMREDELNERSYVSFARKGLGTDADKTLMDSYDFLTK